MSELYLMSIFDRKAEQFNRPFTARSLGEAMRNFGAEVNRGEPDNMMNKYPGDFDLFLVGIFDPATGHVEVSSDDDGQPVTRLVVNGAECLEAPPALDKA